MPFIYTELSHRDSLGEAAFYCLRKLKHKKDILVVHRLLDLLLHHFLLFGHKNITNNFILAQILLIFLHHSF